MSSPGRCTICAWRCGRSIGYGSSDALTRAFLQAGLGRPAAMREALRAIAADPPGTPRVITADR